MSKEDMQKAIEASRVQRFVDMAQGFHELCPFPQAIVSVSIESDAMNLRLEDVVEIKTTIENGLVDLRVVNTLSGFDLFGLSDFEVLTNKMVKDLLKDKDNKLEYTWFATDNLRQRVKITFDLRGDSIEVG